MGVLAKMAKADEPPKPLVATIPSFPPSGFTLAMQQGPVSWTVNLDQMTFLTVHHNGETVKISADEIFAALK
jgi:hypothetical protein